MNTIITARLDMRPPTPADHAGIVALLAPDCVRRHLGQYPTGPADEFARLLRNAGSWALYGYGPFVVRLRGTDETVGSCGVFHTWRGFGKGFDDQPEIGWIFAPSTWGQGLATEAARAVLEWFDRVHGPRRVACMIDAANGPSLSVAAKLGFVAYDEHDLEEDRMILFQRNASQARQELAVADGSAGRYVRD